jgi:DEAD/DEAH box helicase domain-containing protein
VCLGYPGSSASLWQQVGRAGRKGESALGVVVAYDSPVDAYFIRHPDRLLQQPVAEDEEQQENAGSERLNPYLLQAHAICAAAELPLRLPVDSSRRVLNGHGYNAAPRPAARATELQIDPDSVAPEAALDASLFGGFQSLRDLVSGGTGGSARVGDMLSMAVEKGTDLFLPVAGSAATVARSQQRAGSTTKEGSVTSKGMVELWRANPTLWTSCLSQQCRGPQPLVSIRAVGSTFSVQCTRSERELETVESSKAFFSLYEGSLYQHQQQIFKIVEVKPAQRLAYACPLDPPRPKFITQPIFNMTLSVCRREHRRRFGRGVELLYGRLLVSVQVTAYSKCHRRTLEAFEHIPLHGIPPMEALTSGVWLRLGDLREELEHQSRESAGAGGFDFACGLHAANHALRTAANVVLDCDATDLNCEHESNELRILLYDSAAGGTGLSWEAYRHLTEIVDTAVMLLTECACSNGCPSCVLLSEFGCYNGDVCKRSGLTLMAALQSRLTDAGSPPSETLGTMPEEDQP